MAAREQMQFFFVLVRFFVGHRKPDILFPPPHVTAICQHFANKLPPPPCPSANKQIDQQKLSECQRTNGDDLIFSRWPCVCWLCDDDEDCL